MRLKYTVTHHVSDLGWVDKDFHYLSEKYVATVSTTAKRTPPNLRQSNPGPRHDGAPCTSGNPVQGDAPRLQTGFRWFRFGEFSWLEGHLCGNLLSMQDGRTSKI